MKDLHIKTSILFNLDFAKNTVLLYFFFFFLIIDLYFLISAANAQNFNAIAELVVPIGTAIKKVKAEIEINTLNVETKNCSV